MLKHHCVLRQLPTIQARSRCCIKPVRTWRCCIFVLRILIHHRAAHQFQRRYEMNWFIWKKLNAALQPEKNIGPNVHPCSESLKLERTTRDCALIQLKWMFGFFDGDKFKVRKLLSIHLEIRDWVYDTCSSLLNSSPIYFWLRPSSFRIFIWIYFFQFCRREWWCTHNPILT